MPLVGEKQAQEARARLKTKLAQPFPCWGREKTVLTDDQFKARVDWKEVAK